MTDAIDFDELNRKVIQEFRANDGRVGGMFEGAPALLLLRHTGAKSGAERTTPLTPYVEDGRMYIFAGAAGRPANPAWYHNLVANPRATVEFGTQTFPVVARVLAGAEREDIYAKQAALVPQLPEYQHKSGRLIPVVELVRAAA